MKKQCITKHKLDFECCPWPRNESIMCYRIGTVDGLWYCENKTYVILSFRNSVPGNGRLDDVFEWFEFSCKRDGYKLKVCEFLNENFKKHLIEKRGFVDVGSDAVEKQFKQITI